MRTYPVSRISTVELHPSLAVPAYFKFKNMFPFPNPLLKISGRNFTAGHTKILTLRPENLPEANEFDKAETGPLPKPNVDENSDKNEPWVGEEEITEKWLADDEVTDNRNHQRFESEN